MERQCGPARPSPDRGLAPGWPRVKIDAAPDPTAKRAELEAHYLDLSSPFRTAENSGVLDIIDPRQTPQVLCDWIEDASHVVLGDLQRR